MKHDEMFMEGRWAAAQQVVEECERVARDERLHGDARVAYGLERAARIARLLLPADRLTPCQSPERPV